MTLPFVGPVSSLRDVGATYGRVAA
jgi:hypothetical protein